MARLRWLIAFAIGVAAHGCIAAQTPEYAVKAAFVYNFARFVDWPQQPRPALRICIYGDSPISGYMEEAVRAKVVHGVPLSVIRLSEGNQTFENCEVLFVGTLNNGKAGTLLRKLKGRSILTIGETDDFTDGGGMITLFVANDRVRFKINLPAAAEAHLQVSSKLAELGEGGRPRP